MTTKFSLDSDRSNSEIKGTVRDGDVKSQLVSIRTKNDNNLVRDYTLKIHLNGRVQLINQGSFRDTEDSVQV